MLKSITTLFAETGLDEAPYQSEEAEYSLAEYAAAIALKLPRLHDNEPDTSVTATYFQETAIDAMSIALSGILPALNYHDDSSDLPVIDEKAVKKLHDLTENAMWRIESEYADRGRRVKVDNKIHVTKAVHEFCIQYALLYRKCLCLDPLVYNRIQQLLQLACICGITPTNLIENDCLRTDVPSFTETDIKDAANKYVELDQDT